MLTEKPKTEETNQTNKSLDIGEVINDAFEIYKKTALMGGIAFIILMAILTFFGLVGLSYFINPENLQEAMRKFDPEKLSTNGKIIYFGGSILITVLISPFIAGMLKMADDASNNKEVNLSSIFYYVNSQYFLDILLATLIITTFSVGFSLFIKINMPRTVGLLISTIFSLLISILTFITVPFIIFKNLNYIEAIKISIQKIKQHFFVVLLLMLVAGIFVVVGFFAFCIGIFFTIPFAYAMQYSIYKRLS